MNIYLTLPFFLAKFVMIRQCDALIRMYARTYSTGIALYCTVQYIDRHGLILCGQHRHR